MGLIGAVEEAEAEEMGAGTLGGEEEDEELAINTPWLGITVMGEVDLGGSLKVGAV
jgi:hypothetical protein